MFCRWNRPAGEWRMLVLRAHVCRLGVSGRQVPPVAAISPPLWFSYCVWLRASSQGYRISQPKSASEPCTLKQFGVISYVFGDARGSSYNDVCVSLLGVFGGCANHVCLCCVCPSWARIRWGVPRNLNADCITFIGSRTSNHPPAHLFKVC